jgi:hypothetical protein
MGTIIRKLLTPRNLIPSVIILLAFVSAAGPKQIFGFDRDQIVLALLGLLAIDALVERLEHLERIEGEISDVKGLLSPKISAEVFFKDRASMPDLDERMKGAREICISGLSLMTIGTTHLSIFKRKWAEGCQFKFLLVNPESEAAKIAANTPLEALTPDRFVLQIQTSLAGLKDLLLESPMGGKAEIRLLNTVPPFSSLIIDGTQPYGVIQVQLYVYRCPLGQYPIFEIHRVRDWRWYDRFYKAFQELWDEAEPWQG